ncbi:MAG: hypothetical protein LBT00_13100 [Spirochaetaceae bacterium]|nr:hypothetical protein [Spirochaetaceae bacterium]
MENVVIVRRRQLAVSDEAIRPEKAFTLDCFARSNERLARNDVGFTLRVWLPSFSIMRFPFSIPQREGSPV